MHRKLKVFVPGPHWFIRPNNTDWRYTQMLCRLGDFAKNLEMIPEDSWVQAAGINLRMVLGIAARRAHLRLPTRLCYRLPQYRSLSQRELLSVGPDVIFAYECYPLRAPVPVVWMTGPIPEQQFQRKNIQSELEREIAWKRECADSAAQIICTSTFAKNAFCSQTGYATARVHVAPFLLPHLSGGGQAKKSETQNAKLRCLFVGREAVRKGLPRALRIFKEAPHWSLHVITNFADGHVDLPNRVSHQKSASHEEVLEWMTKSDLLFSLSEYDSFGFAAVEAASRQCMPVFRAGSVQQTMFSPAAALFLNDDWSAQACVGAIEDKLTNERQSTREALLSEFRANFSPEKVAEAIYSIALNAVRYENGNSVCVRSPDREGTHSASNPLII